LISVCVLAANAALVFSPLPEALHEQSFATYVHFSPHYVERHCRPTSFSQDGKGYAFGVCDLVFDGDGLISNFSFI
jgi:hypothetical protein